MSKSKQLSVDLSASLETAQVQIPENNDEAWQMAVDGLNMTSVIVVKTGLVFMGLKERLPKGQFEKGLKEHGVALRTAQESMALASAFKALKPAQQRAIVHVGKTKLTQIARLDPEVIEELADGGDIDGKTLDDIDVMSTRELKEHLRKANRSLTRTERELRRTRLHQSEDDPEPFPGSITRIRVHSSAATDMVMDCIDDITALVGQLELADDLSREPASREPELFAASTALVLSAKQIAAKAGELLQFMSDRLDQSDMKLSISNCPLLKPKEVDSVHQMHDFMRANYLTEQAIRESSKPGKPARGRGRPKKNA